MIRRALLAAAIGWAFAHTTLTTALALPDLLAKAELMKGM